MLYTYIKTDKNDIIYCTVLSDKKIDDADYMRLEGCYYDLIGRKYQNKEISEEKYIYNDDGLLILESEYQPKIFSDDRIIKLEQLVADLTEIVLLGGVE